MGSKAKLKDDITLKKHQSAVVFGTFIQWLYTTKYTEKESQAKALYTRPTIDSDMTTKEVASSATMDCSVKAAILAWDLAREMKAPEFQNHVMTRLFAALSATMNDRNSRQVDLGTSLFARPTSKYNHSNTH
jgi:hypothetical protein